MIDAFPVGCVGAEWSEGFGVGRKEVGVGAFELDHPLPDVAMHVVTHRHGEHEEAKRGGGKQDPQEFRWGVFPPEIAEAEHAEVEEDVANGRRSDHAAKAKEQGAEAQAENASECDADAFVVGSKARLFAWLKRRGGFAHLAYPRLTRKASRSESRPTPVKPMA